MTTTAWPSYDSYKNSGVEWIGDVPSSWAMERGKWLFVKKDRPSRAEEEIATCFRDGQVCTSGKKSKILWLVILLTRMPRP